MTVRIRPAVSSDVDALWRLRLRSLREDPEAFDQTPEDAEAKGVGVIRDAATGADDRELAVVADDDRQGFVGVVFVSRSRRPRSHHRARVWGMWVAPEARGQGMGRDLLTLALDWSRRRHVEMLDLWVVTDHHVAIRLYERAGFRICGTTRDGMRWRGHPQDEHQMTIHLPATPADDVATQGGEGSVLRASTGPA